MAYEKQIEDREVYQFPISAPTSLALEGSLGIHPDLELDHEPIQHYSEIWFNLSTLFRNFYNSLPNEIRDRVVETDLLEPFVSEIHTIDGILEQRVSKIKKFYYINSARSLKDFYPNASFRVASTKLQRAYKAIHDGVLERMPMHLTDHDIKRFDVRINPRETTSQSLMVTHYLEELLSAHYFNELHMLESHTGRIRPSYEWGARLYRPSTDKYELDSTFPFTPFTVQVMGTGQTFSPQPIKYRRFVLEMARHEHWSAVTRERRIRSAIRACPKDEIREHLLKFFDYKKI